MSYIPSAETILSRTTGIDATATGTTNLYTVPTGRTCIATRAIIRCTTADAIITPPTLGIGIAAGEIDIFPAAILTGVNAVATVWHMNPVAMSKAGLSTEVVKVGIDIGAVATTMTIAIDLYGYLV